MGANYDASMAAYSYNRAIPGFSASAVASGVPPLPIYQGWNQDTVPLPPYTAPHNSSQYAGYGGASQANSQYYQPMGQQSYHQNTGVAKPFEQTDLSEGEFEDIGASTNTPPVGYTSNNYRGNDGTGYMDTAQRAVYSRAQDYSPQSSYQGKGRSSFHYFRPHSHPSANYHYPSHNPSQIGRQQSDSYSPYVSPGGADLDNQPEEPQSRDPYAPNHSQDPMNGTTQSQYGWAQNGPANRAQQDSSANGYHAAQKPDGRIQALAPSQPALGQHASAANGKSVAEYRKKAQGAILNLLPYDVRYQTYIDEGFKEDIVGALFDDLKMPRTSSKAMNGTHPISSSQPFNEQRNGYGSNGLATGRHDARHSASSLPLGANVQQSKGTSIPQESLSPSTNTASGSTPVKSTTMTEKERTLQTKMEALRKSREERAQKAAAKANPSAASTSAPQVETLKVAESSEKPNSPPKSPIIPDSQSQCSVAQPTPSQQQPRPASPQQPKQLMQQQPPMIPGLFLASAAASPAPLPAPQAALPAPIPSSQRKRPVAADFDDPLPALNTFKRPFGYSPHNDGRPSLVIDLSDDEDEDVAMDLDSQADRDSPVHSVRKMSDPRPSSTHNIPTNLPNRKPFTPPNTSATATPLTSQAAKTSLGRPDVLIRKESEIEELKKKIAEAEARKRARKTPSGTLTPRASESNGSDARDTPDGSLGSKVAASIKMQNLIAIADNKATLEQQKLADAQAAEIEKAAELKRNEVEQKRLRREKIASDLPLVEAEVLQNQTKLEQLRAEMAKIEAAVQKSLEDKQRLAEEMARLGQEAEDQLQEQKDKLNTLTQQESRSSNGMFQFFV